MNNPDTGWIVEPRREMTLCIAAQCVHEDEAAIVVCADMQGTDFAKSDDVKKIRFIRYSRTAIMLSGTISAATELIAAFGPVMRDYYKQEGYGEEVSFDVRADALPTRLRSVAARKRADKIEQYLVANYGLTTASFYGNSASTMPGDTFGRILGELKRLSLDCELVLAHIDDAEPLIITIGADGNVAWEGNYVCIGSGYVIARSFLCQARWDPTMPLIDCAARVYHAKRAAERDPSVGEMTQLLLLSRKAIPRNIRKEGREYIESKRPNLTTPADLELQPNFFDKKRASLDEDRTPD